MSCDPNQRFLTKPLKAEMLYDYPYGAPLKITDDIGKVYVGMVATSGKTRHIETVNTVWLKDNGETVHVGYQRFIHGEFVQVEQMDAEKDLKMKPRKSTPKQKVEYLHHTLIVWSEEVLQKVVKGLDGFNEVALNMHGVYVGRYGKIGWITLFFGDTIVCIDVITLVENMGDDFWSLMAQTLFEKEDVIKVVYNSRPIADYLYHCHVIKIKNVFDIQVAEFFNWCRGQSYGALKSSENIIKYKSLSECMESFLKDDIIPEELKMLKEFENMDFTATSPLMERPVKDKKLCKCVAIQIKYLIRLKTVLMDLMLKKFMLCVSSQMNEIVEGGDSIMQDQLVRPLTIPKRVFRNIVQTPGTFVNVADQKEKSVKKEEEEALV